MVRRVVQPAAGSHPTVWEVVIKGGPGPTSTGLSIAQPLPHAGVRLLRGGAACSIRPGRNRHGGRAVRSGGPSSLAQRRPRRGRHHGSALVCHLLQPGGAPYALLLLGTSPLGLTRRADRRATRRPATHSQSAGRPGGGGTRHQLLPLLRCRVHALAGWGRCSGSASASGHR